jgi:hypothetical protein
MGFPEGMFGGERVPQLQILTLSARLKPCPFKAVLFRIG